jgi:hypothetical protein
MGASLSVVVGDDVGTAGVVVVVGGSDRGAAGGDACCATGDASSRRDALRVSADQRSSIALNDAANANMATIERTATTMAIPDSLNAVTS